MDYTVTYPIDMAIKDKWIIVGKVPFNDYDIPGAFTINNTSYVVAGSQNYSNPQQYLWKFNPTDFSWQQITIPFTCTNSRVVTNGNKAYLYLLSSTNNFYEFDPANNTWTEKADYPGVLRLSGTMFAIGTKVYFGLGLTTITSGSPIADDTFYQYNINTDSWVKIANYPDAAYYGARVCSSAFVINNIGYVGCGATNTSMVSFYSFSPATGTWTRVHDFPDAQSYATGFAFGNYGYIADGEVLAGTPEHDCFKYDPGANSWTHLNDLIGCNTCGWGSERGYAFVNNGNVYVGGGNSASSSYYLYQVAGSGL